MSEADTIDPNALPLTVESLAAQFAECGLAAGQTVIVHSRMSALGWVAGGAVAVIQALLHVLTPSGTLMMPTFSPETTDPASWDNPKMPEHWLPIIRDHLPAYDSRFTPTFEMGNVAETFRTFPGVIRGNHPCASFAAIGPNVRYLVENHISLARFLDDESPVGKLYKLDGYVFLLGVDHGKNTSLHLAEYRTTIPKRIIKESVVMLVDGVRQWVDYDMEDVDDSDFPQLGDAYESAYNIPRGRVGKAEIRFMKQKPLVDFAVEWLEKNRNP
ncbi:MAG: AAC(3) family N-acetyltransferase [Aggregatilineales bacterium]